MDPSLAALLSPFCSFGLPQMKRAWFLAGVLLGGALAADPAPAAVPGLPLLPLLPGMPMLPMPPLSPMPPSGFFSALPFLSLAGRGRGGGMMGSPMCAPRC